jgi:thioester reductase-like protein
VSQRSRRSRPASAKDRAAKRREALRQQARRAREAALARHPDVAQAAIALRNDLRLAAYVALKANGEAALEVRDLAPPLVMDLSDILRELFPAPLVPEVWLQVDQLPLGPDGHPDLNRLAEAAADAESAAQPASETEQRLADIVCAVLGRPEVNPLDDFFKLGGTSMLATQLVFRIQDEFQTSVSLRNLFANPSVRAMADAIDAARAKDGASKAGRAALDFRAEAVLDEAIVPEAPAHPIPDPAHILLTGATGFIGSFLLAELLEQTEADVACLVRARSADEAGKRIESALRHYKVWKPACQSRIRPLAGDLGQPKLGLSQDIFGGLAQTVDAIFHNGAAVNFIQPYAELKPSNVNGTHEVLRLAASGRAKAVHHVSTVSVFPSDHRAADGSIREDEMPADPAGLRLGYTQSKWVAEQLAAIAQRRGLNVSIYRLGRIAGHTETGACQTHDFIWNVIRTCVELNAAPAIDMTVDLVPVDYVARSMVHLSRRAENHGGTYHFVHPAPLSLGQLIEWLQAYGYPLNRLAVGAWRDRLMAKAHHDPHSTAARLVPLLGDAAEAEGMDQQFDDQNLRRGLSGSGIACPPLDARLLATYFDYLIESGFLAAPPVRSGRVSQSENHLARE